MKKLQGLITASLLAFSVVSFSTAQAQQAVGVSSQVSALPPALRAAVLAGNSAAIQQAISTLSGGNPSQAAALAAQVMTAAESLIASNPAGAAAAANAAVNVIRSNPTASMQQTSSVLTAANRIMVNPAVINAAPAVVATIAANSVSIASNPAVVAALPTVAAAVSSAASTVSSNQAVMAAAPTVVGALTQSIAALNTAVNASPIQQVINVPPPLQQQQVVFAASPT